LRLRYFALCKTADTIDSVYYFCGILKEKPAIRETSEGDLHWIKLEDAANLQMSNHTKAFYLHWIENLADDRIHCFFDSDFGLVDFTNR